MSGRSASLVRGWVDFYTRGLPAELRDARRDEIASDLWSQFEEAAVTGRSERETANEMLVRLVAGIPADISWRIAHRGGNPVEATLPHDTTGTVGLGWTAIIAGVGITGLLLRFSEVLTWDTLIFTGMIGGIALALVFAGLVLGFRDRLSQPAAILAWVGAICASLAAFGVWPLGLALPICSAPLIWNLAGARILGRWAAWSQVITAGAMIVMIFEMTLGPQGQIPLLAPLSVVVVFTYPMTWVLIGLSLIRRTVSPKRSTVAA